MVKRIFTEALADDTRRKIFELISEEELMVSHIAQVLPVSRPAVSQHLKRLVDAGLAAARKEGRASWYRMDKSGVDSLRRYVDRYWNAPLQAFEKAAREVRNAEEKLE